MTTAYETRPPMYTRVGHAGCDSPIADALRTQETFTRAQVAWLMSAAMRWGYEVHVDEENRTWPPVDIFFAGELISALDRKAARAESDAAARLPRPSDFPGRVGCGKTELREAA